MALRYPADGFSGDADYVTFSHTEYKGRSPGGGGGYITLYMPESLPQVSNPNSWSVFSPGTGLIGKAKLDAFGGLANGATDIDLTKPMSEDQKTNAIDKMKGYFGGLGASGQGLLKEGALKGVAHAMGMNNPNQAMSVTQGAIFNPNIELAYDGPRHRGFGFSFNFIPKSAADSAAINQIIKEFKTWSAPEAISGGMYKIPHVWNISYTGKAAGYMNKFMPAACVSVDVMDNAGIAYYASHTDGAPVQTTLSLQFMEVDVITRKEAKMGPRGM
jgi:hypothetical protein